MSTGKKKRIGLRLMSLALIFVMAFGTVVPVSAATSGKNNSRTIQVTTRADRRKGRESITLKQRKATYAARRGRVTKTGSIYPTYNITVKDRATGRIVARTTWTSSGMTIYLSSNRSYSITVSYNGTATTRRIGYSNASWRTTPYWYVSSTFKVASCR